MANKINLGRVTAYADAVAQGYTGTREEFAKDLANWTSTAEEMSEAAQTASAQAQAATDAAENATLSEEKAKGYAESAETAKTASETAQTASEAAKESAESAKSAAGLSESNAKLYAQAAKNSQTAAETAQTAAKASADSTAEVYTEFKAKAESGDFDGYSPTVEITENEGSHTVAITDKDGTKSFDVKDGKTGASTWDDLSGKPFSTVGDGLKVVDTTLYNASIVKNIAPLSPQIASFPEAVGYLANAIGAGSKATGSSSNAIGYTAKASGDNTNAIGNNVTASGECSTVIGGYATASGNNAIVINSGAKTFSDVVDISGDDAIAIGEKAVVTEDKSIAIGDSASVSGNGKSARNIAIGAGASSSGGASVAIGPSAKATAIGALVISSGPYGYTTPASATGNKSTAINGTVSGVDAVAIGTRHGDAASQYSVALGYQSATTTDDGDALSIGYGTSGSTTEYTRRIIHVSTPTGDTDAANKAYVDAANPVAIFTAASDTSGNITLNDGATYSDLTTAYNAGKMCFLRILDYPGVIAPATLPIFIYGDDQSFFSGAGSLDGSNTITMTAKWTEDNSVTVTLVAK